MHSPLATALLQQRHAQQPSLGWQARLQALHCGEVRLHEALKRHTTIQIGGPADAMVFPAGLEDLKRALCFVSEEKIPWRVLGLGSNILVKDAGIRGVVFRLHRCLQRLEVFEEDENSVLVEGEAGVALPKLVELARQRGYRGLEALYGIPASLGGALWMNAGTRSGEISDGLESLVVLKADGSLLRYPRKKLRFEYRSLRLPSQDIVISGRWRLLKGPPQEVRSAVAAYQKRRHETQPLDLPNMGSVFKNPEKGFAAQMIEELGLKGVRVGGARISEKHANFIVNEGQATARDVLILIGLIRDKVREELGVRLELEVKVLGDDEAL